MTTRWVTASVVAGCVAGTLATAFQFILWWLVGMPPVANLLRDARLTAAIALGDGVLVPGAASTPLVLLVATLIHFILSVLYAALPARWCGRQTLARDLLAGALYGLLIYALNLYGFTWLFPWFAQVRDASTLAAHAVFGLALVAACRVWRRAASGLP